VQEEIYLRQHIHRHALAEIAECLDRTTGSIHNKSVEMHLSKAPRDGYRMWQVSTALGRSAALIRKWVHEGKIDAMRQGPNARAWSFSQQSIGIFLKNHPEGISKKRMGLLGQLWLEQYGKKEN
jgi:hypothetical protein